MDLREEAAEELSRLGHRGKIAAELAVALGVVEPHQLRGAPAARAWLARGELRRALAELPDRHALARRIESELSVYSLGMGLPVTRRETPHHRGARTRVLFILTNSLPYTQSGYTYRTHSILRELVKQGVEVLAVTRIGYPVTVGRIGRPVRHVIDGVEYQRLPAWRLPVRLDDRLAAHVRALASIVESFKPDVIHTTTDLTNAVVARAVSQMFGLPWVYELRGQLELSWVASRPEPLQKTAEQSERVRLWRMRDAELAQAADRVVVLSGVQRDEMISRGLVAERIIVVPNCVDDEVLQRPRISPADARAKLGLPREGRWVGSVTSIVDYEGLDVLLDAVAMARRQGHDLRVAIVGDGVARPGLIAQTEGLGMGPDVAVLPGRVPSRQALDWYEALDVFAVPRQDTPVCRVVTPLKPLNALALGRPVVVSDLPALREVGSQDADAVIVVGPRTVEEWAGALLRVGDEANAERHAPRWNRASSRLVQSYAAVVNDAEHPFSNGLAAPDQESFC